MLREATRRFLADNCPTSFVRKMMADDSAHDAGFWKKLVELGWPGLLIPESYGGQGGSFLDMTVILEEAGKALVPGPFFTGAILGAMATVEGGSEALKREVLPRMAAGEFIGTLAIAEATGRFDPAGVKLKASKKGAKWVVSGEKMFVPDAHVADGIAVAARTARGSGDSGLTILCVDAKAKGVTITQLKTVDMTRRLCHVKFNKVEVPEANILGVENEGGPLLRRMVEVAATALAVEMVGTAQKALDLAVEYAKTRTQFGK